MLTEGALKYLKPLKHDPNAERLVCLIPMGGIYWADEIPNFRVLIEMPEKDRKSIYRLFSIRFRLWGGELLDADDQAYWDSAVTQVPHYPVFQRVQLSEEDRAAQEAASRECLESFEALVNDADEFTVNEDGTFDFTFDLTKDQPQSIWQRFFSWCRRAIK